MRKLLHAVLIAIVAAFFTEGQSPANARIGYFWTSTERVMLWYSSAAPPIVASKLGSSWSLNPPPTATDNDTWTRAFRSTSSKAESWDAFLSFVQNKRPDEQFVGPKYPDSEIYLRTQSDNSVKVTVQRAGNTLLTTSFELSGSPAATWVSQQVPKSPELGLKTFDELHSFLGTEAHPNSAQLWNNWIEEMKIVDIRHVVFKGSDNLSQWIWHQRMTEAEWVKRASPQMAIPTPAIVAPAAPDLPDPRGLEGPSAARWPVGIFFVGLLAGGAAVWGFPRILSQRRFRAHTKNTSAVKSMSSLPSSGNVAKDEGSFQSDAEAQLSNGMTSDEFPEAAPILADVLKVLSTHRIEGTPTTLVGVVEGFLRTFDEMCDLRRSLEKELQSVRGDLTTVKLERDEAKSSYDEQIKRLVSRQDALEGQLRESESNYENTLNERNAVSSSCRALMADSTKLEKRVESLSIEIEQSRRERSLLVRRAQEVESQVADLAQQAQAAGKRISELQNDLLTERASLSEVAKLQSLSTSFGQGSRYFYDKNQDLASSAIIGFLIQYSFFSLSSALVARDELRQRAMIANLRNIAVRLRNFYGFDEAAQELINSFGSDPGKPIEFDPNSSADSKLFQNFLKHLRENDSIDLLPIYFGAMTDHKTR